MHGDVNPITIEVVASSISNGVSKRTLQFKICDFSKTILTKALLLSKRTWIVGEGFSKPGKNYMVVDETKAIGHLFEWVMSQLSWNSVNKQPSTGLSLRPKQETRAVSYSLVNSINNVIINLKECKLSLEEACDHMLFWSSKEIFVFLSEASLEMKDSYVSKLKTKIVNYADQVLHTKEKGWLNRLEIRTQNSVKMSAQKHAENRVELNKLQKLQRDPTTVKPGSSSAARSNDPGSRFKPGLSTKSSKSRCSQLSRTTT